ncbi:unnamed protein product [Calicophoron daubneyi]|uniref:CBM21 domain-containing protein n=1 Tax=Calicophoron daubneyi TaxID=300641 RepID=A0AAV2T2F3_CALDB
MATAVGLRSNIPRNWTGSLLDLNSCGYPLSDYSDGFEDSFRTSDFSWKSEPTDLSRNDSDSPGYGHLRHKFRNNARLFCSHSMDIQESLNSYKNIEVTGSQDGLNRLSRTQCLVLRQLLTVINKKFRQRHSDEYTNPAGSCPWNIFPVKKQPSFTDSGESDDCQSSSAMPSFSPSSHGMCEHRLLLSLFDANFESSFDNTGSFFSLSKPKRRHCNSESDLRYPDTKHRGSEDAAGIQHSGSLSSLICTNSEVTLAENARAEQLSVNTSVTTTKAGEEDDETIVESQEQDDSNLQKVNESPGCTEPTQFTQMAQMVATGTFIPMVTEVNEPQMEVKVEEVSVTPEASFEQTPCETIEELDPALNAGENTENCAKEEDSPVTVDKTDENIRGNSQDVVPRTQSSSKIPKRVSFADEAGFALTEVHVIEEQSYERQTPDPSQFAPSFKISCDYDDEFDGPMLSFSRQSKFSSTGHPVRFSRSRARQRHPLFEDEFPSRSFNNHMNSEHLKAPDEADEKPRFTWTLCFQQPAAQYLEFRKRIENHSVSLENITIIQPKEDSVSQLPYLSGTIKVKNIAFQKQVLVRLTTDNWRSYTDYSANYNIKLSEGTTYNPTKSDTFSFEIPVDNGIRPDQCTNSPFACQRIEFAVRYLVGENGCIGQFWDSNDGKNYVIERRQAMPSLNSSPTSPTETSFKFETSSEFGPNRTDRFSPYTPDYRPNFEGFTLFTDYRAWSHFAGETTYY